jgi:putative ABC transport system ATP-binding protein
VVKSWGDGPKVLDGVSLTLGEGETLALRGESGSGKSTLLHVIGALETADAGSVRIDGTEVLGLRERDAARLRRTRIGVVFQQFNLIPSLSVADNIAFHARLAGRPPAPGAVEALADRLGLARHLARFPEELSGGQQQRAAVARTLAARPRLILADEPTGNLDEATGDAVLAEMLALAAEIGAALLMVTHSSRLAARLDRQVHLSKGRLT